VKLQRARLADKRRWGALGPGYSGQMGKTFTHRIRVRYAECDAQGVVFNAHYYAYFDHLMTELWRGTIGPYQEMVENGTDMSVVASGARFIAPARFDDEIDLNAQVTRLGNTSMSTAITITRASDGAELVTGEIHHVFVDPATYTKRSIPEDVRAGLEPYLVEVEVEAPA
jgi:acyl-CoA thioester hydrolase